MRIAFLGGSTTFCAEVSSDEHTWPHLVTEGLRLQWPEIEIDSVNAGVPGYSVIHSIRNVETRVAELDPDVVVIYHGHNDLSGNSYQAAQSEGVALGRRDRDLTWLSQVSLFAYLVEKNVLVMSQRWQAETSENRLEVDTERLVSRFRNDLTDLVVASQKAAETVVLVTFSTQLRRDQSPRQKVNAAATSRYYMPYMSIEKLIDAYDAYNLVITQVAEQTDTLLVPGEDSIPGNSEHFVDSIHFTDLGSQAMARRVVQVLSESEVLWEMVAKRKAF